jgi:dihydrofolate reductase
MRPVTGSAAEADGTTSTRPESDDDVAVEAAVRKIIESTLVSLDGVIGDPQTWAVGHLDHAAERDAVDRLLASDAMLMGRRTYETFAEVWPARTGALADRVNRIRKYVFSSTLDRADWSNSTIIRGDVATEAAGLKQQDGQDLTIYGHGRLGRTLLEHGLLDELRFSIHPLLVGHGKLLFQEGDKAPLRLVASETLATGVVVLTYQPAETWR